ncbi:hypothetical protein FRAAL1808 [Frankia alni ACN14a]|uniref:Uncharacterized protein n=1 Tax=Frankia alni (strain DSM 45986 / CECT 9034 / ACN14a) TaxID=326424 RepID=Q0RPS1_FRAAA|nr:hypothetical protein FRAAL1808 [Frankia alni ACN14a]
MGRRWASPCLLASTEFTYPIVPRIRRNTACPAARPERVDQHGTDSAPAEPARTLTAERRGLRSRFSELANR